MSPYPTPTARMARAAAVGLRRRQDRRRRALTEAVLVATLSLGILLVMAAMVDLAHASSLDAVPAGRVGIAAVMGGAFLGMAVTALRVIRSAGREPPRPRRRPPD